MKFFESRDLNDVVILRSQDKKEAIKAFFGRYPTFDKKSVDPFIYEFDVVFDVCLPEYNGWILKKKWKQGQYQQQVIKVIKYTVNALGKERTGIQIRKLWRLDHLEIKKNSKVW
jgi:hypothetical protein